MEVDHVCPSPSISNPWHPWPLSDEDPISPTSIGVTLPDQPWLGETPLPQIHLWRLIISPDVFIIVVISTWPGEKTSHKKNSDITVFRVSWFVEMAHVYAKFRAWCHSFQPFRSHYLCIVVFCLLFSIGKYVKHHVCHSIITRNADINTKQLPWSSAYPWVIKHFTCECLWHHAKDSTQKHLLKNM